MEHDPGVRLPYFWEDDLLTLWPDWDWSTVPSVEGLRIYDFHPCYVALNIKDMRGYGKIKANLNGRPLFEATTDDFAPYVNPGRGSRSFLELLLKTTSEHEFLRISDIADQYRKTHV